MIAKKKGLYLGLLLSMLGIGNVMQAYEVIIKNNTPHTVKFRLNFSPECQLPTAKKLAAGGRVKIWVGQLCTMKSLEAMVQRSGHPTVGAKSLEPAKWQGYYGHPTRTFIISGNDKAGYTVTEAR